MNKAMALIFTLLSIVLGFKFLNDAISVTGVDSATTELLHDAGLYGIVSGVAFSLSMVCSWYLASQLILETPHKPPAGKWAYNSELSWTEEFQKDLEKLIKIGGLRDTAHAIQMAVRFTLSEIDGAVRKSSETEKILQDRIIQARRNEFHLIVDNTRNLNDDGR